MFGPEKMSNEEFYESLKALIEGFNKGHHESASTLSPSKDYRIDKITATFASKTPECDVTVELKRPMVKVKCSKKLLEFGIYKTEGVKHFKLFAHRTTIQAVPRRTVLIRTLNGLATLEF